MIPGQPRVVSIDTLRSPDNVANTAGPTFIMASQSKGPDALYVSQPGGSFATNASPTSANHGDKLMADPSREEVDAKIAASEARSKTDIALFEGKLETLAATLTGKMETLQTSLTGKMETIQASLTGRLDALQTSISDADKYNRDSRLFVLGAFITSALALGLLIAAMAAYGDALFGRDMNVRDVVQAVIKEQQEVQKRDSTPIVPSTPAPTVNKIPGK
jgi:hypothetical protein